MRLTGRTAIVTGAASGIGRATCLKFASEGARVACFDIDEEGASGTQRAIQPKDEGAISIAVDVTDPERVREGVDTALNSFGHVDILVNVAGRNYAGDAGTLDLASWNACLAVNLTSIFLMVNSLWAHFCQRGSGVILNTSSIMGRMGAEKALAYCAAKAGVINMTRCLAVDGAPYGIRANCICPGFVKTPIMDAEFMKADDPRDAETRLLSKLPLRRMATAEEIASSFVFLASGEAAYITGAAIDVDGGIVANLGSRC